MFACVPHNTQCTQTLMCLRTFPITHKPVFFKKDPILIYSSLDSSESEEFPKSSVIYLITFFYFSMSLHSFKNTYR